MRKEAHIPFRTAIRAKDRVAAVKAAAAFVVPPDENLQEYCRLAAEQTGSQMAQVTFVYEQTHHVIADWGFPEGEAISYRPEAQGTWTSSICAYVVASGSLITFRDTMGSRLLADCLAIEQVRAYSGAPLLFHEQVVGALAVVDEFPRSLSSRQLRKLLRLAEQASYELTSREER